MNRPIRVLIADHHPATRAGICAMPGDAPDIQVAGEAQDGTQAKNLLAELGSDVLLFDPAMPGLGPLDLEAWVDEKPPGTRMLALTAHDTDCYLASAIAAGVTGFLTKDVAPEQLVEAIRRAAAGEMLITHEQMMRAKHWDREVGERWKSLTEREREVLVLLCQARSNKQIAQDLKIEEHTVETHVGNLLAKLGVGSRAEAIVWAWQCGLADELDFSSGSPPAQSGGK